MAKDNFGRLIDREVRCRAVSSAGRRCQLYHDRDGVHAHGWREKTDRAPGQGRPLPPFHVLRWDSSREWLVESVERLRWCALASE